MACVEVKVRRLMGTRADWKDIAIGVNRRADCENILWFLRCLLSRWYPRRRARVMLKFVFHFGYGGLGICSSGVDLLYLSLLLLSWWYSLSKTSPDKRGSRDFCSSKVHFLHFGVYYFQHTELIFSGAGAWPPNDGMYSPNLCSESTIHLIHLQKHLLQYVLQNGVYVDRNDLQLSTIPMENQIRVRQRQQNSSLSGRSPRKAYHVWLPCPWICSRGGNTERKGSDTPKIARCRQRRITAPETRWRARGAPEEILVSGMGALQLAMRHSQWPYKTCLYIIKKGSEMIHAKGTNPGLCWVRWLLRA